MSKPVFRRQNTGLIVEEEIYVLEFSDLKLHQQIGKGRRNRNKWLGVYCSYSLLGSFGRVFIGEYLGTEVAVKQIYRDETQKNELERFLERELAISKYRYFPSK